MKDMPCGFNVKGIIQCGVVGGMFNRTPQLEGGVKNKEREVEV